MLRKVPLDQVRLGMFVYALEGSWLHHPFWRRRFLLDKEQDLHRLRESDIPGIIIDDERGAAPEPPRTFRPSLPVAANPVRRDAPDDRRPAARVAPMPSRWRVDDEAALARMIVNKSKRAAMRIFGEARMGRAVTVSGVVPLVAEISAAVACNPSALIEAARLTRKDDDIHLHSVAVCVLMINFARALQLDERLVCELGLAGLLHDIGKVGVPDALLKKPDKLSDDEYTVVREHSPRGYELVVASPDAPAIAAEVVLHHHERYDGTGYPHGLKGAAISLYARMASICDVYDAITSTRSYRQAWAPAEAIAHMLEWKGQFDPELLDAFIRSIGIYPVGSLVRLRSNRLGIVLSGNSRQPTRPTVKAFYAVPERVAIRPEIVPIGPSFRDDAILTRERPEHWNLGDWPALRAALLARR